MKILKRAAVFLLVSIIISVIFTGCNKKSKSGDNGKISIVCTIFPQYDWVRQIIGESNENIELKLLLKNGTDLHSYQPTVDDMISISESDLFIYVGGESDKWVDDALKNVKNQNMKVINLLDVLGTAVKEEEIVEGMQEDDHDPHDEDEPEYDEHVWLSLKNAKIFCEKITSELLTLDSENSEVYENNLADYIESLEKLDSDYQLAADNAKFKTVLFGDRFPFRYLIDDYDIDYFAAFVGCSAETEASFETIAFLADKVDELGLNYVITIEDAKHKIAETIISNTQSKSQSVVSLNSMQSVTLKDAQSGTTYLSLMEGNLDALKKALG